MGGKSTMPAVDRPAAKIVICLLLMAAIWGVFGQVRQFPFVNYDDPAYTNPVIAKGITAAGLRYAFTFGEIGHWHPLTWISHMIDFEVYGADRPGGHHTTSVVLHLASAILLFLLLSNVTGAAGPSAFVAFVFAIHPLRVESVAWIAERKDVLSGVFFVLTLAAYVAYVRRRRPLWFGMALLLFALGLMSKNMLVSVPFVLLLLDGWPLQRDLTRNVLLEKIPFLILSIISVVITLNVPETLPSSERVTLVERAKEVVVTPARYLVEMVYPRDLGVYYPYRPLPLWAVIAAFLALIGISASAVRLRKRAPYVLMGWLWYLVMLGPVAGIVQISNYSHADRYTYLPHIGISLAVAWGAYSLANGRQARVALACAAAMAVIGLGVLARVQTAFWASSLALWTHDLEAAGPSAVAYHGVGDALMSSGKTPEALREFQLAVETDPNYFPAHESLGQALVASGRVAESVPHFEEAIRLWPPYTLAHIDLGNALLTTNRPNEALAHFEEARRLRPDNFEAIAGIGNSEMRLGRPDEAFQSYRAALDLRPRSPTALANAGSAAAAAGRLDEGTAYLREAASRDPSNAAVHCQLGNALLRENHLQEAEAEYRTAIQIDPHDGEAHRRLGVVLSGTGRADEGVAEYRSAIREDANDVEAYVLLGSALALRHETAEAIAILERAANIDRGEHPEIFDRLAAVYAMSGRFSDAAKAAGEGADLAEKHGDAQTAKSLRADVSDYTSRARRR